MWLVFILERVLTQQALTWMPCVNGPRMGVRLAYWPVKYLDEHRNLRYVDG